MNWLKLYNQHIQKLLRMAEIKKKKKKFNEAKLSCLTVKYLHVLGSYVKMKNAS